MIDNDTQNKIKEFLQRGYSCEILSDELEIPLDEIREVQRNYTTERLRREEYRRKNLSSFAYSKMEGICKRYFELYYGEHEAKNIKRATPYEKDLIDNTIEKIRKMIDGAKEGDYSTNQNLVEQLCVCFNEIRRLPATAEQGKAVVDLFRSQVILDTLKYTQDRNSFSTVPRTVKIYKIYKKDTLAWFTTALFNSYLQCESIEDYKSLLRMISSDIQKEDSIKICSIRDKISSKIRDIQSEEMKKRQLDDISPELKNLILQIAEGELDENEAKMIVDREKDKMPKPTYNTNDTDEAKREKIYLIISMLLRERPELYSIKNPEKTIAILMKFLKKDQELATNIVVNSLITEKRFSEALEVCENSQKSSDDFIVKRRFESLKKRVEYAQIGSIIEKGLWARGTQEEEDSFIDLIERRLKKIGADKKQIELGSTKDGKKKITLDDIWTERIRY